MYLCGMKTKEKFWNWVMGIKPKHVAWTCVVVFLLLVSAWFPFPFGVPVNWRYTTYEVNYRGVFYTSCPYAMLFFPFTGNASAEYLEDADFMSFRVLDENWAKDKNHVWYECYPVKGVDAATFHFGKNGIPKDQYHVFVHDLWYYYPSSCNIDPATAEFFVQQPLDFDYRTEKVKLYWNDDWMRDSRHVYYYEQRVDVDRATFRWLAGSEWFSEQGEWYVDKNFVYTIRRTENYNPDRDSRPPFYLVRVDTLREPLEVIPYFYDDKQKGDTIYHASHYLRNGHHILYADDSKSMVVGNINVKSIHFEKDGLMPYICVINDTLRLQRGERITDAQKASAQLQDAVK